jgi:nitroreductase
MSRLLEIIQKRYSTRALSTQTIEREHIELLFEAARWAPSSMNAQPWHFVYTQRNSDNFQIIHNCLLEGNKPWAQHASLFIVCLSESVFSYNEKPNRHHMYDLGQAVAYLTLQATSMNLYLRQMGGVNFEKLREELKINAKFEIASVMALGYKGDENLLPEELKLKELLPRKRKELKEIITEI